MTGPGDLSGTRQTLLITLYAKALDSRSKLSVLNDHFADEAVRKLDYDFSTLAIGDGSNVALAARAKWFDVRARAFITAQPDSVVLNLGCGLDSRIFRVEPPTSVQWFDLDLPDVIDLRRQVYPPYPGSRLISSSVTAFEWLEGIPSDKPAIILAEGLMLYLRESEVMSALQRLLAHFPSGELILDAYSRLGLHLIALSPAIRRTGAELHWHLDDAQELERRLPGLTLQQETHGYDMASFASLPWYSRALLRVWGRIPVLRRVGRLLRYTFHNPNGVTFQDAE